MDGPSSSYLEWDAAGAAFDAELETMNLDSHDIPELAPLPDEKWMEWINLPSNINEPRSPTIASNTEHDTASDFQDLCSPQSDVLFSNVLPTSGHSRLIHGPFGSPEPTAVGG